MPGIRSDGEEVVVIYATWVVWSMVWCAGDIKDMPLAAECGHYAVSRGPRCVVNANTLYNIAAVAQRRQFGGDCFSPRCTNLPL